MAALKSEGKCVYCEKTYDRKGIGRHLTTHLKKEVEASKSAKKSYHIKVPAAEMFLHLLVSSTTTLEELDNFFRAIWLECCGHMSSFEVKGKQYNYGYDVMEFGEKKSTKVGKLFKKGVKLDYQYDFGSTTHLLIEVVNEYKINVPKKIKLLSRNEPLPILCHDCNKQPAVAICSVCIYEGKCLFCETCSDKHATTCGDFEDYARLEVVNSPRMGVCAYEGGVIDTERDGVWQGEGSGKN